MAELTATLYAAARLPDGRRASTGPMAAVIGTPIAVGIAQQLGHSPEACVLAVLFGANMSYATPMAYKTNLLIFGAGGYKFTDFLRVGVPITLLMWVAFTVVLPIYFPL